MLSGFELRNTFNRIIRTLYTIKDNSGNSPSGRHYYAKIKSSYYIDTYIEMCYDLLENYDKIDYINENEIILFVNDFIKYSLHFLENPIKETTKIKSKKIIIEFLNEIKNSYEDKKVTKKIEKSIKKIENYEFKNPFENLNTKNYVEKTEEIKSNKNFEKKYIIKKKPKKTNNIYEKLEHLKYCILEFSISENNKNLIQKEFNKIFTKSKTLNNESLIKSFAKDYIKLSKSLLNLVDDNDFELIKDYLISTANEIEKKLSQKKTNFEFNLVKNIKNIEKNEKSSIKKEEDNKNKEYHKEEKLENKENKINFK